MAIPLQGLAAASMMLCATEHREHHQVSVTQNSQIAEHQHHADEDHEGHEHHAQAHDANAQSADVSPAQAQPCKDKCSSCASCCVGAAMLTSSLNLPVLRPSSEKIDMVFSSHLAHISDSLKRPPRA